MKKIKAFLFSALHIYGIAYLSLFTLNTLTPVPFCLITSVIFANLGIVEAVSENVVKGAVGDCVDASRT